METEIITFEEFGQLLDEVAEALPKDIFVDLNGGINLIYEALPHPQAESDLFILGEYHQGGNLGRYINIYYQSFINIYPKSTAKSLKAKIDKVLRHEFLHHLESMAGEKDLEIQDAIDLAKYNRHKRRQ